MDVDWAIGLEFSCNDKKCIIVNVYTPYECYQNEAEYLNRLGCIMSFIQDNPSTCIYILGDMNADVSDDKSLFGNHLLQFCADNGLILSSKALMPVNSFTYISEAWHSTSWLDHCLCTADAHEAIESMIIHYEMATSDHIPLSIMVNVGSLPLLLTHEDSSGSGRVDWSRLTQEDIDTYVHHTDMLLGNIELPKDAIFCRDMNCKNQEHCKALCSLYDYIVNSISASSKSLHKPKSIRGVKPGWNHYVEGLHAEARAAFKSWAEAGKGRSGPLFEHKKHTNAQFKYALRYIKRNENILRSDSLARKLQLNSVNEFWKEIRVINNSKTPLPSSIDGVSGPDESSFLWRKKYQELVNCVKSNVTAVENVEFEAGVIITPSEIANAILMLGDNKASGMDNITAEHVKYASRKLYPLLSLCFTGCLVHGILPDSLMAVVLVPVIKDKAGKLNSSANYRPIALANILSKVLERILLNRLERYILTSDNQFGFKHKHSTDMCIFALKEVLDNYNRQNSSVFVCLIDASQAFDRVNHELMFIKLCERGVPKYLVRILAFWYAHQTMRVRWGKSTSEPFFVCNGVRQGGILSPLLFNVYMDDLSRRLNTCRTGCMVGDCLINHLMYADDVVVWSPCTAGLQELLNICTQYGIDHDIKYNSKKSNILIVRSGDDRQSKFPVFSLSGSALNECREVKYLGHVITNDLSDDIDIYRQCRKLYGQANMLCRRFSMCSVSVKIALFRSFCTPLYTAHLWCRYRQSSLRRLTVAYNDGMRLLLRAPRSCSASHMFVSVGVPTCPALLRNLMYKFMCRLVLSDNDVIAAICNPRRSSVRFTSRLWRHWRTRSC